MLAASLASLIAGGGGLAMRDAQAPGLSIAAEAHGWAAEAHDWAAEAHGWAAEDRSLAAAAAAESRILASPAGQRVIAVSLASPRAFLCFSLAPIKSNYVKIDVRCAPPPHSLSSAWAAAGSAGWWPRKS